MRQLIIDKLKEIELEQDISILYACESGSRAWGFESKDSDYDVRFIYIHNSIDWYLKILKGNDVLDIETGLSKHCTDLLDFSGWDIKKALFLLMKSSACLFEWLHSPIVYKQDIAFMNKFTNLSKEYFIPKSVIYHYLNQAKGNFVKYLQGSEVKSKKYMYAVRPIFACYWILEKGTRPPLNFEELFTFMQSNYLITSSQVVENISSLLKQKKEGVEMGLVPKDLYLNIYIQEVFISLKKNIDSMPNITRKSPDKLDRLFVDLILDRLFVDLINTKKDNVKSNLL